MNIFNSKQPQLYLVINYTMRLCLLSGRFIFGVQKCTTLQSNREKTQDLYVSKFREQTKSVLINKCEAKVDRTFTFQSRAQRRAEIASIAIFRRWRAAIRNGTCFIAHTFLSHHSVPRNPRYFPSRDRSDRLQLIDDDSELRKPPGSRGGKHQEKGAK